MLFKIEESLNIPKILLLCSLIAMGCSKSYMDKVERGAGYEFRPGFPEVRLVTSSYISPEGETMLNLASEIVYGSLIYKKKDDLFIADALMDVQINTLDNTSNIIESKQYPLQLTDPKSNVVLSQKTYKIEKNYQVPPGNYEIIVTVTDINTDKETVRKTQTFVPNPNGTVKNITNIRILSLNKSVRDDFIPVTTYDIPGKADSLKFLFQVTNNDPSQPLTINTRLVKFESDTSIALPMNFSTYRPSSIEFKGIDYSEREEISSTRRVLNDPGSVLIEFVSPELERGNYRLEVFSNLGKENEIYKARDFGVKSYSYPSLTTPKELAAPLYYLMRKGEYEDLMQLEDPDEIKKAIDRFWLRNIKNSKIAKDVVSLYYERVEQANKQFSNFKEGWKTDQGMIYILFGPPWYVETVLDYMRWGYSYNSGDPEKNFIFQTPKLKNKYYPFENYILERNNNYYNIQYQQIQLWLSGAILKRDI